MDRERRQTADQLAARITAEVSVDARSAARWDAAVGDMRIIRNPKDREAAVVEIVTPGGDVVTVDYYPLGTIGIHRLLSRSVEQARRAR